MTGITAGRPAVMTVAVDPARQTSGTSSYDRLLRLEPTSRAGYVEVTVTH